MRVLSRWRRPDKVVVYKAGDGWRWHRVAANGRIVADSGEAYGRKADAKRAALRKNPEVTVVVKDVLP